MKRVIYSVVAVSSLFFVNLTGATTLIDMYGDEDGFGLGAVENDIFSYLDVKADNDMGFTDQWINRLPSGNISTYTHNWDSSLLAGPVTSAYLEVFSGGQGMYGSDTEISLNGHAVGNLANGQTGSFNYARLDVFNILSLVDFSSSASLIVSINTALSYDSWVLDYSKLTISDDPAPVPEPATMMLFGTGLVGLAGMGKHRRSRVAGGGK